MYGKAIRLALMAAFCGAAVTAHASFIVPVDTDGADDGPFTPHPNFSFGPGTTAPELTSVRAALWDWNVLTVVGLPDGDSIFGGDAVADPDTYQYSYTPGIDGDNTAIAAGTALNDDGDNASGLAAGSSGTYRVYATWPQTTNVDGGSGGPQGTNLGDVLYALDAGGPDIASVVVDQNEDGPLSGTPGTVTGADGNVRGGEWQFLFEVTLDANTAYTLRQQPTFNNGFVSMRSGGVMFELVPEPASALLTLAGAFFGLAVRRRRS